MWLNDKLIIAFVYANILTPQGLSWGAVDNRVPLAKLLLAAALLIHAPRLSIGAAVVSRANRFYIPAALGSIILLGVVGLLKGSEFANVMVFTWPVLVVLMIPLMRDLLDRHGPNRYLVHVVVASTLLSALLIGTAIAVVQYGQRETALRIVEQLGYGALAFPVYGLRFNVTTSLFFAASVLISLHFAKRHPGWLLLSFVNIGGLLIDQTASLWIATVIGVIAWSVLQKRARYTLLAATLVVGMLGVSYSGALGDAQDALLLGGAKNDSISQKLSQAADALKLFEQAPVFGAGLGHVYRSGEVADLSGFENLFIEFSYAMILSSTGLMGLVCYGFIYFFNMLRYLHRKRVSEEAQILFLCQCMAFIAAVGNPYLWSGGMGLFFGTLLAALFDTRSETSQLWRGNLGNVYDRHRGSELELPEFHRRLLRGPGPARVGRPHLYRRQRIDGRLA